MNGNLAYQEVWREELIGGKVVAMSPSPSWNPVSIAGNIYHIFKTYLKGKKCVPIPDGFDLHLTSQDVFIPDFMIVCDRNKIKGNGVHGAPDLVVEVLSPSTMQNDKFYKKDMYAKCGVREYWIVSPTERSVEIYWSNNGVFDLCDTLIYMNRMPEPLSAAEHTAVVTHFKCSLYDDLEISLEEIFCDLLP